MYRRLGLWENRLAALIAEAQRKPFRWGSHDCALLAADAVKALIGEDPAAGLRGAYTTEEEAAAILAPFGGLKGLAKAFCEGWEFESVSPLLAQRGDVVLADFHGRVTLGVVIGAQAAFPREPEGLVYIPMTSKLVIQAWRVA